MRQSKRFPTNAVALLLCFSWTSVAYAEQPATPYTQYLRDNAGNVTQAITVDGYQRRQTQFVYDNLGRPAKMQGPDAASAFDVEPFDQPMVPTTLFQYDAGGKTTQVMDPNGVATTFTYDVRGNTTVQQSADSGTAKATYDAVGNQITRTDARGRTTTYTYDALNRLTKAAYATGAASEFEYDGGANSSSKSDIGHLTRITDESGSTRFQYDGFGNLLQKVQASTANGVTVTQTVAYAYGTSGNANGKRISQTYPSGNVIGYSYDNGGRIAGLTLTTSAGSRALLSNIGYYYPLGKPSVWTWGNGTTYARTFDQMGRLVWFPLGAAGGSGATPNGLRRELHYDGASRVTAYSHTNAKDGSVDGDATEANQSFGHNNQDRLIGYIPGRGASQSYTYDGNGNRYGQTIGSSSYTQTIGSMSNRQTASTGPTVAKNTFDAAGNLTGDGTATYSYSDRGRLASVTKAGTTTNYLYNGLEQRIVKQGSGVSTGATRYVYDDAGHLIGEYDQAGTSIQETVYLGDLPVVTIKNGAVYYVYVDQIDTPRVITDTNNLMVWRWDRGDPYGASLPDENPSGLGVFAYNLRFPGQVYDQEAGKHHNGNRDYDPVTGRYIQADPIGLAGGGNRYAYVNGSPLSATDPLGLVPNPAEAACALGPNPVCVGGVVVDIGSWIIGGLGAGAVAAAVSTPGSTQQSQARQDEYDAYKNRCNEKPPEGLDACELAEWKLKRNKECRSMRQAWDDKWLPGRHANDIANLDRGIQKLEEWIKQNCKKGCKK